MYVCEICFKNVSSIKYLNILICLACLSVSLFFREKCSPRIKKNGLCHGKLKLSLEEAAHGLRI